MDLALNNLQWLICHKIKPNKNKLIINYSLSEFFDIVAGVLQGNIFAP